jgi:hypothetical protein
MYVYIDETGNTGGNLFDESQPDFLTAGLMSKSNFDLLNRGKIKKIAQQLNDSCIHANKVGKYKVNQIAPYLLKVFRDSNVRFLVARVEKKYLAVSKIIDTLFDSFENKAVPWHVYNFRPLRLLLVFKVGSILSEDDLRLFWGAIVKKNKDSAYEDFVLFLKELQPRVHTIPDDRSRVIISDAINWGIAHPESIYLHTSSKVARAGHRPNAAVFSMLLDGIDKQSKKWKRPVREIIHDRQSQFEKVLKEMHEIFSNAKHGIVRAPFEEPRSLRVVSGSKFMIESSENSPGIQCIDTVLWLYKKVLYDEGLLSDSKELMKHVFKYSSFFELSFRAAEASVTEQLKEINSEELSNEDYKKGQELLNEFEANRIEKMQSYINSGG